MAELLEKPIGLPVKPAAKKLGVGVSTMYGLIDAGEVETFTIGRRRLVLVASLEAYVDRRRVAQGGYQPQSVPWRPPSRPTRRRKP
jgi:excisionase family DNA binding protein